MTRSKKIQLGANNKVIKNLYYVSPYASLPPYASLAGVTLYADKSQMPPGLKNPVLVIRLRLTTSPTAIGVSPTGSVGTSPVSATYQPLFPLSATEPYMVDVIWVEQGTSPSGIDWGSAVTSAPVTAAAVSVRNASFDGTNVTATVDYGPTGIGVGTQVSVYAISAGVQVIIGSQQAQGNTVTVPVKSGYSPPYSIFAQSIVPANNTAGQGSFSAPFSMGPLGQPVIIPQAAKTMSAINYDGKNMSVSWTLDGIAGCPMPTESLVELLSSSNVIASFKGGPSSASFPASVSNLANITVRVRTIAASVSSVPLTGNVFSVAPVITNVTADLAGGKVNADVTTTPAGLPVQAFLTDGDNILAGPIAAVSGKISFTYAAAGLVGLGVVAYMQSPDAVSTGPRSNAAMLLATAPNLTLGKTYIDLKSTSNPFLIDLVWDRLPDRADTITSYTVSIMQNGTALATKTLAATSTTLSLDRTKIDPLSDQTIELYAKGLSGGNSPVQSLPALFVPPQLTDLTTTSDELLISWNPPRVALGSSALPVSYEAIVLNGLQKRVYVGPSVISTVCAVPLSQIFTWRGSPSSVMINVTMGPLQLITDPVMSSLSKQAVATPDLIRPIVLPATTDPLTNISTLHWTSTNASSYTLNFSDGTSKSSTTNSFTLPAALVAGQQLAFNVTAQGISNLIPTTGPPSDRATMPSAQVSLRTLRFDGANVYASWAAIENAIAYTLSVYDNSNPSVQVFSKTTTDLSLSFALTCDASKTYTARVQPVMSSGTGLSGPPQPLFAASFFASKQPASAAAPYVYPATKLSTLGTAAAGPTAELLTAYLPELCSTAGALGATPISVPPFTISPSGNTALPYKLTIDASAAAWAFDKTAIRPALQLAYTNFLKKLEAPGAPATAGATPYGISIVQAVIGRLMPQTFTEMLYYNFGLSALTSVGAGYVDLKPGMVLRAVIGDYISIPEFDVPSFIKGYAGAAVLDFEIGSYTSGTSWLTGFDAFLNTLCAQNILSPGAPDKGSTNNVQAGVAAATDLYYRDFVQPFYRLFFPGSIQDPTGFGSNTTTLNFTMAAASTYTALSTVGIDPTVNATAYFRGRTTLEVMIRVTLNGAERLVPAGSSLGNLLEQAGIRPAGASPLMQKLRLYRSIVPAVTALDSPLGPELEVRIDWNGLSTYGLGNGLDALSMPLLPGDAIVTHSETAL